VRVAIGILSVLLLAGCSSSPASAPPAAGAPATPQAPTATSTAPAASAAPLDAPGELAKLKAAGLPIGATGVVTAADDPNHLLGRPNGYTSKVYWTDTRVDPTKLYPSSVGGTDPGGAIESYPDVAGAQARKDYIGAIAKASPALANEYDYLAGSSLIRVSSLLTPDQAKQYEAAA
jgi:hypothetical protein